MHRSKAEVDKHVESLLAKLSLKEFKSRAYSIARLYYDAGDYLSCKRYVEQYMSVREQDAAAHKLLGLTLQQLGEKEKALEQFKTSLDIDPSQTSLILEICILLSDDEVFIDPGRARYWCERAQAEFPRHPATLNLRERLLAQSDPDPEALVRLLKAELQQRPRDASLHARLLKQLLINKKYNEAFDHSFDVEFGENNTFRSNYAWYEVLSEVLALDEDGRKAGDWRRPLLELTVAERLCCLSITEGSGDNKSLIEAAAALHRFDQSLQRASAASAVPGNAAFNSALLQHHSGQFCLYAACFLLKKAKKDQLSWKEAVRPTSPLFLLAWHTAPLDPNASWLTHVPEKQRAAARRWHIEGSFRCSQSGHCLLAGIHDKNHTFIDRVSQYCSGNNWKDKLYEKLFTNRDQLNQSKTSYFLSDNVNPTLRLPRRNEVQAYDVVAQKMYPSSLHHMVWMLMQYKHYSHFKVVLFDMLRPSCQNYPNCGPETLNRLDVEAFLYAAAFTASQQKKIARIPGYLPEELPELLPANITDLLCSPGQMKWWDCAVKVSQNDVGTELSDIRSTVRRGLEVIRCIDNHGLDPELLCKIAAVFSERAKNATGADEKENLEAHASLYYSAALPLLEKLKSKLMIWLSGKRMFEYNRKELSSKEILCMIEESKLFVGETYMNEGNSEKAIEILTGLKSSRSSFLMSKIYMKMAFDEIDSSKEHITSEDRSKHVILLSKAKEWAYTTADRLKCHPDERLETETQNLIEQIEKGLSHINPDMSNLHDFDNKYSSDDNASSDNSHIEQVHRPMRSVNSVYRNINSTPKQHGFSNSTHYKSAIDSHLFDSSRSERKHLERIESQIKSLHKKESSMSSFMEHTKSWIEENRHLGEEVRELKNSLADKIIDKINSNIQDTVNQFKSLKHSVDQVKDKIGEYRDECKNDVGDLKKEVAELKKEVSKLKHTAAEQTIDDSDLYNLDDYQASEATPAFSAQLPFTTPQVLPQFNQRVVPPVALPPAAYSIYGQSLYNLYSQYSQMAQQPIQPNPLFDPTRPVNYPGSFPPTDYAEVPHFPPSVAPPVIPTVIPPPVVPTVTRPSVVQNKEVPRSLPANVVITSSDPMPSRTSLPQPIMSVTIPPQHLKNSPHNYQITMPTTVSNLNFNVGISSATTPVTAAKPFTWGQTSISMAPTQIVNTIPLVSSTFDSSKNGLFDSPKSTVTIDSKTSVLGFNSSFTSPNASLNKSRTLSEKSNTSVEYDPCPDFKPIIPLPDEVKVTTGEENETTIFSARAKLYRYTDKEWKERGLGEMKILKHNTTGKVRILMRREQIHKICANHVITPEMELTPMKNESKAYVWVANDFADETVVLEKFCVRFKTTDVGKDFYETFEKARKESNAPKDNKNTDATKGVSTAQTPKVAISQTSTSKPILGGFTFSSTPTFKEVKDEKPGKIEENKSEETAAVKQNLFSGFNFKSQTSSPFANIFTTPAVSESAKVAQTSNNNSSNQLNTSDVVEEFEPSVDFKPVVPLPALVEQKTGEEDETILFEHRAKLLRFDGATKEWKERGLGNIKILAHKNDDQKVRLLMRREIVMKVCCNHGITKEMKFQRMPNQDKALTWCAKDFSEGELTSETFCLKFKTPLICDDFMSTVEEVQKKLSTAKETKNKEKTEDNLPAKGFGDQFKPKPGSWSCQSCYTNNVATSLKCIACESPKVPAEKTKPTAQCNLPVSVANWGDKFKPKAGSWECAQCLIRNDAHLEYCSACESPKDPSKPKKESKSILDTPGAPKFSFGIPTATNAGKTTTTPAFGVPAPDVSRSVASPVVTFGTNNQTKPPATFSFGIPGTVSPSTGSSQKVEEPSSRTMPFDQAKTQSKSPPKNASLSFAKESGTFDFVMKPKTKGKSPKSPEQAGNVSDDDTYEEDEGHHIHFTPVIPLPDEVDVKTGEENETELYSHRAKLFRFVAGEWKERGIGIVKILKHNENGKLRVLMRREQIHKICLNHVLTHEVMYTNKDDKTWLFTANDYSEGEISFQQFCLRFKSKDIADEFKKAIDNARSEIEHKDATSVKSGSSDDVVFVNEVQASPEDKQRAKDLMLPENFFTYKDKQSCPGCRGCEQSEENTLTAAPLHAPINLTVNTPNKSPFAASPSSSIFTTPMTVNKSMDNTIFATPMGGSDDSWKNEDRNPAIDKENSTPKSINTARPALLETPKLASTGEQNAETQSVFGQSLPEQKSAFKIASEQKPVFGSLFNQKTDVKSIFGTNANPSEQKVPAFGVAVNQKSAPTSIFGTATQSQPDTKSIFGTSTQNSIFGKSVFGSDASKPNESSLIFGAATPQKPEVQSIFGTPGDKQVEVKSIFGSSTDTKSDAKSIFGSFNKQKPEVMSIFGSPSEQNTQAKPMFGSLAEHKQEVKSIFGSPNQQKPEIKSIFGLPNEQKQESASIFGGNKNVEAKSIFGLPSGLNSDTKSVFGTTKPAFGFATEQKPTFGSGDNKPEQKSIFGGSSITEEKPLFGSSAEQKSGSIFASSNTNGTPTFGSIANVDSKTPNLFSALSKTTSNTNEEAPTPFSTNSDLTFAALSSTSDENGIAIKKSENFKWEGAGQQLFNKSDKPKLDKSAGEAEGAEGEEEYDPHYEPIVPLPDKIVVTTGEEDEEKLFCERAKLYRYDEKAREWKERGVGDMKILYHPQRNTYRLLLRREQVYKAVLNMLLFKDLELLPMKNSDRAWTWAAMNYAENPSGEMESLAVRFKSVDLATKFQDKVVEVVRKLQVADAQAYRERQEAATAQAAPFAPVAPPTPQPTTPVPEYATDEANYEYDDEYDYYNDEEYQDDGEDCAQVLAESPGAATVLTAGRPQPEHYAEAVVQLLLEPELYVHKLLLVDGATGEILADTMVAPEMPIQLEGSTARWTGSDYMADVEEEKTVAFTFASEEEANVLYEAVQNCKNDVAD